MKLRDLAMGLDFIHPSGGSKKGKRLLEKSVHPIVEAYLEVLIAQKVKTDDVAKIYVRLTAPSTFTLDTKRFFCCLGVADPLCRFDFDKFLVSTRSRRRRMILNTLHKGAVDAAHRLGIDETAFALARKTVIRNGYRYENVISPPVWNRTRRSWAQLRLWGDLDFGRIELLLGVRGNEKIGIKCIGTRSYLDMQPVWEQWKIRWASESSISILTSKGSGAPTVIVKSIDVSKIRISHRRAELSPIRNADRN